MKILALFIGLSVYHFYLHAQVVVPVQIPECPTANIEDMHEAKSEFQINPNPVNNYLNILIDGEVSGNIECRFFDLQGKEIGRYFFNSSGGLAEVIDMSGYSSGVYLLNIITPAKVYNCRIIKN